MACSRVNITFTFMTKVVTLIIENIHGISFVYSFMDLFIIGVAVVYPKEIQFGNRVLTYSMEQSPS